jgi:DUF1680 family protein
MEGTDNGDVGLDRIALQPARVEHFDVEHRDDLLGGVTVLRGEGSLIQDSGWNDDTLYRRRNPSITKPVDVMAIPYATWDNRAPGEMRVWFRMD